MPRSRCLGRPCRLPPDAGRWPVWQWRCAAVEKEEWRAETSIRMLLRHQWKKLNTTDSVSQLWVHYEFIGATCTLKCVQWDKSESARCDEESSARTSMSTPEFEALHPKCSSLISMRPPGTLSPNRRLLRPMQRSTDSTVEQRIEFTGIELYFDCRLQPVEWPVIR